MSSQVVDKKMEHQFYWKLNYALNDEVAERKEELQCVSCGFNYLKKTEFFGTENVIVDIFLDHE